MIWQEGIYKNDILRKPLIDDAIDLIFIIFFIIYF